MTATKLNPLDKLLGAIATAIGEWEEKNSAEYLRNKVFETLDASQNQIVLSLLGFSHHWGEWELDRSLNQGKESPAGTYLRETNKEAIQEWMSKIFPLTLSAKDEAQLTKAMKKEYFHIMHTELRHKVHARASADLDALLDTLLESNQLPLYLKTLQLIKPT